MTYQYENERVHQTKLLIHDPEAMAYQRMVDFAASLESDLDELIARATAYLDEGNYWSEGGRFAGQSLYPEFWDDFAHVTGRKVENDQSDPYRRSSFFSCSC
jgi:hypothetical protein